MNLIKKSLKWFFKSYIWVFLLFFFADFISKQLIVRYQDNITGGLNGGVDIIPHFLGINYLVNDKFMMGIDLGGPLVNRIVFIVFALLASGLIIFMLIKRWDKLKTINKICMMMVLSGAIGNTVDRIFYDTAFLRYGNVTGVVDWIDFYGIWPFNFNIADTAVVIAAIITIIVTIIEIVVEVKAEKQLEKQQAKDNQVEKKLSKTEQEQIELRNKDSEDHNE